MREKIRSIGVNFSIDATTGMPTATPVFNRGAEERTIEELCSLTEDYSRKKKMVVAFDEFQEIASYGGDAFEKLLRKSIQHHERKGVIHGYNRKSV